MAEIVGPANIGFGATAGAAGAGGVILSGVIARGFSMLRSNSLRFGISDCMTGATGFGTVSMTTPVFSSTVFSALESEDDGNGMAFMTEARGMVDVPGIVECIADADSGNTGSAGFSSAPVTMLTGL